MEPNGDFEWLGRDEIIAAKWNYLAEGNSSIVYSCDEDRRNVLRVKKKYLKSICKISDDRSLENDRAFIEKVLKPLFGNEKYFVQTRVVRLTEEVKEKLKEITLLTSRRPDERVLKDFKLGSSAIMMPHLGFYHSKHEDFSPHSFAIEIKPKWGFLPEVSDTLLLEHHHNDDVTTCRFCMHQHLKLKTKKISSISSYCPLDLFANCSCRLMQALCSLFEGPQNNLRVFHDGKMIYSGLAIGGEKNDISSIELILKDIPLDATEKRLTVNDLINIVTNIFIKDSWQGAESKKTFGSCNALLTPICKSKEIVPFKGTQCTTMGPYGILKKLLKLQQICTVDASSIQSIIENIKQNEATALEGLEDFTSQKWTSLILEMKNATKSLSQNDDNLLKIQSFMVAATFKDCSIMITFRKWTGENNNTQENIIMEPASKSLFAYTVKLLDLDPKKVEKIDYYKNLDCDIFKAYVEHMRENKNEIVS